MKLELLLVTKVISISGKNKHDMGFVNANLISTCKFLKLINTEVRSGNTSAYLIRRFLLVCKQEYRAIKNTSIDSLRKDSAGEIAFVSP